MQGKKAKGEVGNRQGGNNMQGKTMGEGEKRGKGEGGNMLRKVEQRVNRERRKQ